jgi:hypothetical protein
MRRVGLVLMGMAMLLSLPAAGAWARGDGWQPLPFPPFDGSCGATTVHVSALVDKEYYLQSTLPDGTIQWDVTGSLKINYATDQGGSVNVNASGPGTLFFLPNGDTHILAQGLSSYAFTPEQAQDVGVPQITVSAGPIDLTFHPDGSASGHLGNIIENVCAELGV